MLFEQTLRQKRSFAAQGTHVSLNAPKHQRWIRLLKKRFSLCLYGYGDKAAALVALSKLLPETHAAHLAKARVYAAIKAEVTEFVRATSKKPVVLVSAIEHLEQKTLLFFSTLAKKKLLLFVCTVDSVSAALSIPPWFQSSLSAVWLGCETAIEYSLDTEAVAQTTTRLSTLQHVLACVSTTTRSVFAQTVSCSEGCSVSLQLAFERCKAKLLVSNKKAFRLHLTEFIDHKIFKVLRDKEGTETISYDSKVCLSAITKL